MKKNLNRIYGGLIVLISLFLTYFEYERILHPIPNFIATGRYIDFSILLYLSRWIIYFLLLIAGLFTFFKLKNANMFLLVFSFTVLLENILNELFYIVKTIEGYPKYILLCISVISIIFASLNIFNTKKISVVKMILSLILSISIVYLPNILITFYF